MNIFVNPIDTSTEANDVLHLALQFAVAQELANCPKLLHYLEVQATVAAYDIFNMEGLCKRDANNAHVNLAYQTGCIDAYKHLFELHSKVTDIEAQYIQKTRGTN